jgi:hypothetical protein
VGDIGIDFVGPLSETYSGHNSVFIFIDRLNAYTLHQQDIMRIVGDTVSRSLPQYPIAVTQLFAILSSVRVHIKRPSWQSSVNKDHHLTHLFC